MVWARAQGDVVAASHLLIKHQGSRRPASWKDESGAEITKRTKEAAKEILLKHRCPPCVLQNTRKRIPRGQA